MKKVLFSLVAFVLLCSLILVGCGDKETAEPTTQAPSEPTQAPAPAAEEVIELKLSSWHNPQSTPGKMVDAWINEVEALVGDKVQITCYPSATLGSNEDHYNMVTTGVADIATGGGDPIKWGYRVTSLPFMFDSAEQAGWVGWQLIEDKLMDTEYKDVKPLWLIPVPLDNLAYNRKPIETLEDMKGMKLATGSEIGLETLEALGSTATYIPPPEMYTALERGLIDGLATNWEKAIVFMEHEVTDYRTDKIGLWCNLMMVYMNWDVWNSLPKEVQDAFEQTGGFDYSVANGKAFDEVEKVMRNVIAEADDKAGKPGFIDISPEERIRWKEATQSVWETWKTSAEKEGVNAEEILDYVQTKIEEYANR